MHNSGTTIIVKGDYVQEKHVQYQIGDVASGGIGVLIQTPQPPEGGGAGESPATGNSVTTESPVTTDSSATTERNTPYKNDYVGLVKWIEAEKQEGRDWYQINNRNRSAMCRQLTEVLGWVVDQNSLLYAQKRQHKST